MFTRWTVILAAVFMAVASMAADTRQPVPPQPEILPKNRPVVVLDSQRLFKESKLAQQLQKELETWRSGVNAEMQPKVEDLKKRQAELQEQGSKLNAADKEKKTKELQELQQSLYQRQRQLQQELQERERTAFGKFQAKLEPIVDALAKANGWDLVVNKSEQTIWVNGAVDITDAVLKRLDAATEAPASK